jgi:hypothetical protein
MLPTTRWRSQPTVGAKPAGAVPLPFPEFRLVVDKRLNLMVTGPQSALEAAIVALEPWLPLPLWTWHEGIGLHLPPEPGGTLVLTEVGRLDRDQQQELVRWMELPGPRPQIISTTSEPLFALVERRMFLDLLYYRLNVVRRDIGNDRTAV